MIKNVHYKLLLNPDLYFGEVYTDGKITFKNGNISDFFRSCTEKYWVEKTNAISEFINTIRGSYRYLTNFNFIKKSKKSVSSSL